MEVWECKGVVTTVRVAVSVWMTVTVVVRAVVVMLTGDECVGGTVEVVLEIGRRVLADAERVTEEAAEREMKGSALTPMATAYQGF